MSYAERLRWCQWNARPDVLPSRSRLYVGNESCEALLPRPDVACELARRMREMGTSLTLMTPFLTEVGFRRTLDVVDRLVGVAVGLEVVCNDWGLCAVLAGRYEGRCTPVVGRLLVASVPTHAGRRCSMLPRSRPRAPGSTL